MKRAALYARFSSDLQSDRSIEDQFALCRTKAKREDFKIVAEFEDRAKSGASIVGRDGLGKMLEAARDGRFNTLVVEALDRLSRDQEDLAFIFKHLSFQDITIETVHDGRADQIQVGVRGIVSALYLTDLANKTRRGQAGNVREGKHAGGLAYGYRPTPGKPGEWKVNEAEAAIVRRIYNEYVAGSSTKSICLRLNTEGVKPPRGKYWLQNTLIGSRKRQNGILGNEVYCGRLVWNRTRMLKNPASGKRVSRVNAEADWHRANVPHLKIVEPELFNQAAAIRSKRATVVNPRLRRPKTLFSGLLRCGKCGGTLGIQDVRPKGVRMRCTTYQRAHACTNSRSYWLHEIEQTLLGGLRAELADPRGIKFFIDEYQAERRRLARRGLKERSNLEAQLNTATRRFDRAYRDALDSDAPMSSFRSTLDALRIEKEAVEARLTKLREPVPYVAVHPAAVSRYLAVLEDIASRPAGSQSAFQIRDLIESASVRPVPLGERLVVDVKGKLASLLGLSVFPEKTLGETGGSEGPLPPIPRTGFSPVFDGLPPSHGLARMVSLSRSHPLPGGGGSSTHGQFPSRARQVAAHRAPPLVLSNLRARRA
jgi:DNA invertase Pin-like site-specific DNA recombinase